METMNFLGATWLFFRFFTGHRSLEIHQSPVYLGSRLNGAGGGKGTYKGNAMGKSKGEPKGTWTSKAAKGQSKGQATRKAEGGPT